MEEPRPHSFRNSIYRHKGKIYIGREDWYSAYRRNRGPNGVIRKLVLESNRRKKASITFPPVPPELEGQDTVGSSGHSINVSNDTVDDYSSMAHRFGRARVTGDNSTSSCSPGSNSESKSATGSKDDEGDQKEEEQESIQGVRKHKVVAVPVPVNIRHEGLIPKSRSGGHRSYNLPIDDSPYRVRSLILRGIWMMSVSLVMDGFLT
ncbi:hypothetical protein BGZ93_010542 [Podila epicladia]|nr:hypothetical protein BGZ93_010542 [Podila epicladia]KAG0090493.1 hypothetical protein BGZ92_002812 [Podila epicladia]